MGQDGSSDLVKYRAALGQCLVIQNAETQEEGIELVEKFFQGAVSCAMCLRRLRGIRSTMKLIIVSTHSQQKSQGHKHTFSARDAL